MSFNQNSGYGRALLDAVQKAIPSFGRIFIVANSSDYADYKYSYLQDIFKTDPEGQVRFFTDLATAYAATQSNNNDVIVLDNHTSHKVTSMLTVSNSRVHFMGFDGGGRKIGARTLISNTGTGAATDVAMVYVTGTGCSFRNISFKNNWTVAQNLYSVKDWGIQTYFENCDVENLGSAHLTNASAASLNLGGNECIYKNCTIGQDTLLVTSTAGQQILISNRGSSSTKSTRSRFEDCRIQSYTSDTTHVFVRAGANAIDRSVTFDDCEFDNNLTATSAATLAVAAATDASVAGELHFSYPKIYGASNLATAAVGNTSVYVVSAVLGAAASDCVAVQAS